jgi:hypothetical protein
MKTAEILRKLADVIDQQSGAESRPSNSVPHAELEPVAVDNTDNTETATMIAPLQQKLELLKKSVENQTCSTCGTSPCGCDDEGQEDELSFIKKAAGVPVIVAHTAGEDNDIGD